MDLELWYFAYGSNLNKDQMKERVGNWKVSRKARLKDYRVVFRSYSGDWEGGVADIERDDGSIVLGALYKLDEGQIKKLDKYEGVPKHYGRVKVVVEDDSGTKVEAVAYAMTKSEGYSKPSRTYVGTIVLGLRQHGYGDEELPNFVDLVGKK